MKIFRVFLITVILMTALSGAEHRAFAGPYAWFEANGDRSNIELITNFNPDGTLAYYQRSIIFQEANVYWAGLDIFLFPVASILYNINVTNYSQSTMTFNLGLGIPSNILAGQSTEVSSRSSVLVEDGTGDGVLISPTAAKLEISYLDGIDLGIGIGNALSTSHVPVDDHIGPKPGPNGPGSFFSTNIGFSLTGKGDYASLTLNQASMIAGPEPVPEPITILLLGIGLIWLAGVRRKFQNHPTPFRRVL